jgi:hypothetical protein
MFARVFSEVKRFQAVQYAFYPIPVVIEYFSNPPGMTEEDGYRRSLDLEPRAQRGHSDSIEAPK